MLWAQRKLANELVKNIAIYRCVGVCACVCLFLFNENIVQAAQRTAKYTWPVHIHKLLFHNVLGRRGKLPTHAIAAAAAVVGPRFWLSPVDIAINFHAYLLFCRTSLIIKNKSIFNGVFEKQTLLVRASVRLVLFWGSFGLRQLARKLVALKCCVYCWVLFILFVFGFIFLFALLIGHTTACWQEIQ